MDQLPANNLIYQQYGDTYSDQLPFVDLDNLDQYFNVNPDDVSFTYESCSKVAMLGYSKFCTFIDIFKNITETPYGFGLSVADEVVYILYSIYVKRNLTKDEIFKLHLQIIHKGHSKSAFDDTSDLEYTSYGVDYAMYTSNQNYLIKYSNVISQLYRITNSDDIQICNLSDAVIAAIKVLLLVAKTRVVPKCIVCYKILYFYLC